MKPKVSWSYSSLTAFEMCPRRYYHTKIAKDVIEPQNTSAQWGDTVHKALEARIKTKSPLPPGMEKWESIAAKFDSPKGRVFTEKQICLNQQFRETGWFSKDAWLRGVIDVGVDAGPKMYMADWKTGKRSTDNKQLMLFAALAFETFPYVNRVKTQFIWLKENKVDSKDFNREDLPLIWQEFLPRVSRIEKAIDDDKWPPKPSGLCKGWCPVGKDKCEFSGK